MIIIVNISKLCCYFTRNNKLHGLSILIIMKISLYLALYKNVRYVSPEDNQIWP